MIYQLLHDLKRYWGDKDSLVPEEKDLLQRLTKALPTILCERSCEQLAPGEVLVRICPDTRRQVLVCHNGDGQCACLHNGTIEEDAADVKLWLQTEGREANGTGKLWKHLWTWPTMRGRTDFGQKGTHARS